MFVMIITKDTVKNALRNVKDAVTAADAVISYGKVRRSERHELKRMLTEPQYHILLSRISAVLEPDSYMPEPEGYRVSSLYLDDLAESAYYEKLSGVHYRMKYRFRWYNYSPELIHLECKEKRGDRIFKRSAAVSRNCLESYIKGDYRLLDACDAPVCREVSRLSRERGLSPRVVVCYTRQAFQLPLSHTRITFDTALTADPQFDSLFSRDSEALFPVPLPMLMPAHMSPGCILEIKYNEYIPKYISELLTSHSEVLAMSKYVLCRDALNLIR